jgi:hypothetical protein
LSIFLSFAVNGSIWAKKYRAIVKNIISTKLNKRQKLFFLKYHIIQQYRNNKKIKIIKNIL